MILQWKKAVFFVFDDPRWKKKLLIGGLLFFPIPAFGWIMALGYRSITGLRLVKGEEPLFVEWTGHYHEIFRRGIRSCGIILSHFTPFLAMYWILGLSSPDSLTIYWREIIIFFCLITLFPALFLPIMPVYYFIKYPWIEFTSFEIGVLILLFLGAFFILPASFMQVGLYGRYSAAFRAKSAWTFVLQNPRVYFEAWIISLAVSVIALLMGPLAAWGLFWSYLVILYVFMEALSKWNHPDVHDRFKDSKLIRI